MDQSKDKWSRRRFLSLAGASAAVAGGMACTRQPTEYILPYVQTPEAVTVGEPRFYATAAALWGPAVGILVKSHMGRPTKIEGNPDHPSSLGATDARTQAALRTLYDPKRSQAVLRAGQVATWEDFVPELRGRLGDAGDGFRLLTRRVYSPSLASEIDRFLQAFPGARWHQHEALVRDSAREAAEQVFGQDVQPHLRLEKADVILALDTDFLHEGPGSLRLAREFSDRRREPGAAGMNRLYAIEPSPSLTGTMADHRLALKPSEIVAFVRGLSSRLGLGSSGRRLDDRTERFLDVLSDDLRSHAGASVVLAGEHLHPFVQGTVHVLNDALGNRDRTVSYLEPSHFAPAREAESLRRLVSDIDDGEVATLLVLGGNPVYDAPIDLAFGEALAKVTFRAHVGLYENETSELCHWHVPEAHFLESWSDARAEDGTASIVQPLIAPLYNGHTHAEVMAALRGESRTAHAIVREHWRESTFGPDLEARFRRSLRDGVVAGTAFEPLSVKADSAFVDAPPDQAESAGVEVCFRPDPTVGDGRFAENPWLQELPKPLQKITWDNVALVSPSMATELGLENEDVLEIEVGERSLEAPVWVQVGQAPGTVTLHLGYGGDRGGYDAYRLRVSDRLSWMGGARLRRTGERHPLAVAHEHHRMEGRDIGRIVDLSQLPTLERREGPGLDESLYPAWPYTGYAWAMAIDTNVCTGCSACVVACQSENNIPVVGKDEVARGREMHWIRIDDYYVEDGESESILHLPLACVHCENAPCEVVCPVGATLHGPEGRNQMIYNRCIGTRYCSNNCPYKVRRFNFFHFSYIDEPVLALLQNPEVTVRSRGVMEKCTYCVQRIERTRIGAEKEDRKIRDGEIVPACEQVCPTKAIVFGDQNDPASRVSRLKSDRRSYGLLDELDTRPRTDHLVRVRNPHPDLERS